MMLRKKLIKEGSFAIGSPALICQIIFFYLPLIFMLLTSITKISETNVFLGFTFKNFSSLLSTAHFIIILNSLLLALTTALLCLLIAYPLAHFIAFRGGKYKTAFLFFLIVPFWTNFLLHVYAWFFVLEREGFLNNLLLSLGLIQGPIHFLNSYFAVVLMMVYCYLPFMVLPLFSSLERFDRYLLEVSDDLGATSKQTFFNVMLPLTFPAIKAGFFLVLIPAFGEFIIPELVGGDKRYFVGNVVSQYLLGETSVGLGAAFMVMSCLALIITTIACLFLSKKISKSFSRRIQ